MLLCLLRSDPDRPDQQKGVREVLYEKIVELIGPVPAGLEPVLYIVCCLILVWLLSTFFSILWNFFRLIGGDRRG